MKDILLVLGILGIAIGVVMTIPLIITSALSTRNIQAPFCWLTASFVILLVRYLMLLRQRIENLEAE